MSKRFTDTDIWREDWFLELPPAYMLFWSWLRDHCDFAGFYRPNKSAFERMTGHKINLQDVLQLFNADREPGEERILVLSNGKWFLTGFIPFQYGRVLNLASKVHKSIYNQLLQNEVNLTSIRPQVGVSPTPKEKDKDKDIKNTIDKEKGLTKKDERNAQIQEVIDYAKSKDFGLQGSQEKNRQFAWHLLHKKDAEGKPFGVEQVKKLIDFAVLARPDQYAPQCNDFMQLWKRWQDLLAHFDKKQKGGRIG